MIARWVKELAGAQEAVVNDRANPELGDRAAPPGWAFHLILLGAVMATWWVVSNPMANLGLYLGCGLALVVLVITWFVRALAFAHRRPELGSLWPLLIGPVIAALFVATIATNLPTRVRFAFSRAAMEDLIESGHGDITVTAPQRVGLYSVGSVQQLEAGSLVQTGDGGTFTEGGFAYFPDGEASAPGPSHHFEHLDGPWWTWWISD